MGAGLAAMILLVAVGCGGDGRLSPSAFCDRIEALNPGGPTDPGAADALASGFTELAPQAPTPELGDAVAELATLFGVFAEAEREGGDAIAEFLEYGQDPSMIAAAETFEEFLVEECGVELGVPEGD